MRASENVGRTSVLFIGIIDNVHDDLDSDFDRDSRVCILSCLIKY